MDEVADDEEGGEDGVGEFEAGAGEEAEEGAPGGADGFTALLAAEEFAHKGTNEGPEDDTDKPLGAEGESDDTDNESDIAAPHASLAASMAFGAEGGDDVVEYGDDYGDGGCGDKEEGCVVGCGGKVEQQQCEPAKWRTCEAGDDGTGYAYNGEQDGEDDEDGVHDWVGLFLRFVYFVKDVSQLLLVGDKGLEFFHLGLVA